MAVLGLRFCVRAFSSCGEWGPLFITVRGPLTITASPVAEHKLQTRRLSSCGSRAQPLRGLWDLPRPGLEPVSPALAGRVSTTAPPGKPPSLVFCLCFFFFSFALPSYVGGFLAFWEVWGLLPVFSRCSIGAVPRVDVFLMYLWGGRWSPRLTLPPSSAESLNFFMLSFTAQKFLNFN